MTLFSAQPDSRDGETGNNRGLGLDFSVSLGVPGHFLVSLGLVSMGAADSSMEHPESCDRETGNSQGLGLDFSVSLGLLGDFLVSLDLVSLDARAALPTELAFFEVLCPTADLLFVLGSVSVSWRHFLDPKNTCSSFCDTSTSSSLACW